MVLQHYHIPKLDNTIFELDYAEQQIIQNIVAFH